MFRSDRILIILGVLLAAGAFAVFYFYSTKTVSEQESAAAAVVDVQVLVAAKDVPAQTVLTADMLRVQSVDQRSVTPDNLIEPGQAIGKTNVSALMKGQRVLASQLGEPNFSLSIPQGKRAMAVAVDDLSGVAGLLREGDFVDVLATVKAPEGGLNQEIATGDQKPEERPTTKTVIQDVQVLKVIQPSAPILEGQEQEPAAQQETVASSMIVLAVTDQQAELIKHTRETGLVHLVLRAKDDRGVEETTGTTLRLLLETYGFPTP